MWLSQKFEHSFVEAELSYVLRMHVCELITRALEFNQKKFKIFDEQKLWDDETQPKFSSPKPKQE